MASIFDLDYSTVMPKRESPLPEKRLMTAVSKGNTEAVKSILESTETKLNLTSKLNGFNCAHIAARKGFTEIISIIINYDSSLIYSLTDDCRSLHMLAAFEDKLDTLRFLCEFNRSRSFQNFESGAQFNFRTHMDAMGNSVLHFSVWGGSLQCTKYLIETCGCNINSVNNDNLTPLQFASAGNHSDIAIYILSVLSSSKEESSIGGLNSLHRAALHGSLDVIKVLTDPSSNHPLIDIDAQTLNGTSALHLAAKHGNYDTVKYLVEDCHASVELKNDFGLTALHFSCIGAEKRVVEFLLSKGASVVARTAAGDTALHLAASNGRHELCPLLAEQNGIDLFATNYEGKTPIESALASGFKELANKIAFLATVDWRTNELLDGFVES